MYHEANESSHNPPTTTMPAVKWTTTFTYDIYMVVTPSDNHSGDDNNGNNANPDDNTCEPGSSLGSNN